MQNIFTISLYNKRHVENTSATHFHRASTQCINELCLSLLYGSRDDQIISTNTKITQLCIYAGRGTDSRVQRSIDKCATKIW